MSRIEEKFVYCKKKNEGTLVAYLMAGDPDFNQSLTALCAVAAGGADIIELGVPFSDPMADGKVIQLAAIRALAAGTYMPQIFSLVAKFREDHTTPLLLMTYWNPILQYGIERTCQEAKAAGVDGLLISDLPPEEATEWLAAANTYGIDTIFLLAPTSPEKRIKLVAQVGSGFTYCVARLGVTGEHADLPADLFALIARIKEFSTAPVAVGFGVSTPDQVHQICQHADGAIVGSALVKLIASHAGKDTLRDAVMRFIASLKAGTFIEDEGAATNECSNGK